MKKKQARNTKEKAKQMEIESINEEIDSFHKKRKSELKTNKVQHFIDLETQINTSEIDFEHFITQIMSKNSRNILQNHLKLLKNTFNGQNHLKIRDRRLRRMLLEIDEQRKKHKFAYSLLPDHG